jgi:DNA repair exonuclease SbcCD ATPase subunit
MAKQAPGDFLLEKHSKESHESEAKTHQCVIGVTVSLPFHEYQHLLALVKSREELVKHRDDLIAALASVTCDNKKLTVQIEELQQQLSSSEARIRELTSEIEKLRKLLGESEKRIRDLELNRAQADIDIRDLKNDGRQKDAAMSDLRKSNHELRQERAEDKRESKREKTEWNRKFDELKRANDEISAENKRMNDILAARQLVKDVESAIIDEVLSGSELATEYPDPEDRWNLSLRALLKCLKMSATDSVAHAQAARKLDVEARRAGYRNAEALAAAIKNVARSGNELAHDDARTRLMTLSAQERAGLVKDIRLARMYEERFFSWNS